MSEFISPLYPVPDLAGTAQGFLRQSELIGNPRTGQRGLLPFSRTTLWRLVREGRFPAPVKLSANITAWHAAEVQSWIAQHC